MNSSQSITSSKPANPEAPRLRSRPAVNRNGGRLACVDGGRKHRLPHKRGSSEPEGCVRCSPDATRRHAAMARLAVVPAPGSWPVENGASPPWRCAARETWRTNGGRACTSSSGLKPIRPSRPYVSPAGSGTPQLASRRLLQPQLNLMKFSLAHNPGQAEQQTVTIEVVRIAGCQEARPVQAASAAGRFQTEPAGQPFLNGCPGRPATFTRML